MNIAIESIISGLYLWPAKLDFLGMDLKISVFNKYLILIALNVYYWITRWLSYKFKCVNMEQLLIISEPQFL